MLDKQGLVCFPIKPAFARIDARLAEVMVETPGEQQTDSPPAPQALKDPLLQKIPLSGFEVVWNGLFPVDEIHHQKIFGAEGGHAFLANFLQKTQEIWILNLSMEGEPHEMPIGAREIRQWLALPDALAEDKVKPLPGPLDQTALTQNLGYTTVARILLPKDILWSNAQGEAAGADDFDATWVLAYKH